ncbi:MAG: polyprenyl synthetase family protein [Bifidobacteriaceae bacterium]|jgi:geranylgeranyl diphosphate synthase type II|nr:polyprenyl synthetase family protein [Bifidobacteriaceae bacterium]
MTTNSNFEKELLINISKAIKNYEYFKPFPEISECIINSLSGSSFRRAKMISNDLQFAISIELFHNAALIHDDIIDKAKTRRFQKSVPEAIGSDNALLAGNLLYSLSYKVFKKEVENLADKFSYKRKNVEEIIDLFEKTFSLVQEGQLKDIIMEKREIPFSDWKKLEDDIKDIIFKKTTSYTFILPESLSHFAKTGEMLDQKILKSLSEKGLEFQKRDDWQNVFSKKEETGKEPLSDIFSKKKTLLLLAALKAHKDEAAEKIIKLYNSSAQITDADAKYIKNCMKNV